MSRFILSLFLLVSLKVLSQDVSGLLRQGAQLEAQFREDGALSKYQEVLRVQPRNVQALCRCSDLSCRIGNRQPNKDKKIDFFKSGYAYAKLAYGVDSTNSEANIVMAFSLARMALIQSGKERVASANAIKWFAESSVRYDQGNYKGYHILGRWNYEVSGLSSIERTLARWFFGALLPASLDSAIHYYEKSKALKPDFLLNYYELARCYHRAGKDDKAIQQLHQLEQLKDEMYDDREVRSDARKLLQDLQD